MESGVSRRRGQKTALTTTRRKKMSAKMVLVGMIVIMTLLAIIPLGAWFFLFNTAGTRSDASTMRTAIVNNDVSLVECTISTEFVEQHGDDSVILKNNTGANGILQITVRHDLSPIQSKSFLELVNARHFDEIFIFRVLKGFIAQFGHRTAGSFPVNVTRPSKIADEINNQTLSNIRGTLSYAGGNPATMQVFVNLGDNRRLDKENSRPFATVNDDSMKLLDKLYMGYKDGQGQIVTINQGEMEVRKKFPNMSRIQQCRVVHSSSLIK